MLVGLHCPGQTMTDKSAALPLPPSHPTKALTGPTLAPPPKPKPRKRRHPNAVEAGRPHQWTKSASLDPYGQPGWLNQGAGANPECGVCKVTLLSGNINADHAGFSDQVAARPDFQRAMANATGSFIYQDAKGKTFESQVPLGCPVFVGDEIGTTMANKERYRQVDDRVDGVEDRVDDVTEVAVSNEDRITRLEMENRELRSRVDSAQGDVTAVVQWLAEMVALHTASNRESVQVHVEGRGVAALPPPVAELILDLGALPQRVQVPVGEVLDAEFEVTSED